MSGRQHNPEVDHFYLHEEHLKRLDYLSIEVIKKADLLNGKLLKIIRGQKIRTRKAVRE